jgi:hypothetical protein
LSGEGVNLAGIPQHALSRPAASDSKARMRWRFLFSDHG